MAQCVRIKKNGEQCRLNAMIGGTVCNKHGGRAPRTRDAAARRLAEAEARKILAEDKIWDFDAQPVSDPVEALALLLGRQEHAEKVIAARVDAPECPCCAIAEVDPTYLRLLQSIQAELGKNLDRLAKLGLKERQVQMEEFRLFMLAEALRAGLAAGGIDEDRDEARAIAARSAALAKMDELSARGFVYKTGLPPHEIMASHVVPHPGVDSA